MLPFSTALLTPLTPPVQDTTPKPKTRGNTKQETLNQPVQVSAVVRTAISLEYSSLTHHVGIPWVFHPESILKRVKATLPTWHVRATISRG